MTNFENDTFARSFGTFHEGRQIPSRGIELNPTKHPRFVAVQARRGLCYVLTLR